MAGFGKAKDLQVQEEEAEELASTPVTQRTDSGAFAALRAEFEQLQQGGPKTHIFMGIIGHENTGKTGIVFDFFQKYCDEEDEPKYLAVLDFDGGGAATKSAFYPDNKYIKCWDPWVMNVNDRTAYDYPATHDRVMSILQYTLSEHEEYWGVLVTGVDLFDSVATNCMRIADLGLSRDGIDAADNRGAGTGRRVEYQWDWAIRTTRFHQMTALCRGLVKRGVRVFWETHLKMTNYSSANEQNAQWRPAWEKSTNNYMYQIVLCERNDITDDSGEVVMSEYTATFEKSKTDAALQGQKSITLRTEQGKRPTWNGLPELRNL
jgi:hypothetical protein